jgi:hypothetical protein
MPEHALAQYCWACRPCTRLGNAEHGTTFQTEDQLIISGADLGGVPQDRFWAAGLAFRGNALLVGYLPLSGDIASRPQRTIDEFRRLITFATPSHDCASQCLFPERQKKSTCEGAARVMRASKRSRNRRGVGRPLDVPVKRGTPDSVSVVPDDLKIDIAHVVRTFRFTGMDTGTCSARVPDTLVAFQRGWSC